MLADILCIHAQGTEPFAVSGDAQTILDFQKHLSSKWPDLHTHIIHNFKIGEESYDDHH